MLAFAPTRGSAYNASVATVLEAIYARRATRAYTVETVARAQVETLIEAAIQAPSAVNAQPWAFVVIQDRDLLDRYADEAKALWLGEPTAEVTASGLPEIDRLRQMVSEPGYAMFHRASTLVVIYATSTDSVRDCFLAAQNLMLAAWDLGLGTCPIGLAGPLFNRAEVREELGIALAWVAALPIVVGHPAGTAPTVPRRPPIVTWR